MINISKSMAVMAVGFFCLAGQVWAQSTMTDDQVLEYVQQGVAEGKSQDAMISELTLRGVTKDQAQRVYAKYQNRQDRNASREEDEESSRAHTVSTKVDEAQVTSFVAENTEVFGRNIFRNRSLNFAPSENLATPRNYRLGPGDEIIIDVFGRNQTTLRGIISPEGSIKVDVLGPLYLSGMTVEEANDYLKKRLGQIYGGLNGRSGTDMRLSLGQIRAIQINVVGDVVTPGTYTLSSFATAFHALYQAGGVVDPGTLRDIKVVRGDYVVARIDVYEFLMKGSMKDDIRLEEGDVILVQPYKNLVSVEGGVKRAMFFEMKDGETMADLIEYAGGFTNGANASSVTVYRQNHKSFEVRTVDDNEYASFQLQNGDRIEVGELQSRFENRISIHGSVFFPGTYELSESVHTAKELIEKAGGLLPEAFTDRVVVHREYDDKSKEVFSLNLTEVLSGNRPDFVLQNNDELFISSSFDLKEQGVMTISGMVMNPGEYPFAENTTIEDFIIMAGGLLDGASMSRVDVTRRKKDANGLVATDDIGELYSFSLEHGLGDTGVKGFVLEPYDEVVVHRSPSYNVQRHFTIAGEVNFPGTYSFTSREERVTDLIKKAGGLTSYAYLKGAKLVRQTTDVERSQDKKANEYLEAQRDSVKVRNMVKTVSTYSISLDLEAALANPGGDADVILREGDRLEIPLGSNVIRIHGAVQYPTAVNYDITMRGKDYIEAAGGYSKKAMRNKAYYVDMSGRAKRLYAGTKVQPGSEIFVPEKEKKESKMDWQGVVAISSAAASLSSVSMYIMYMINYLKK